MSNIDLTKPIKRGQSRVIMRREAEDSFDFSCEVVLHNTGFRGPYLSIRYERNGVETDGMDLLMSDIIPMVAALNLLSFADE